MTNLIRHTRAALYAGLAMTLSAAAGEFPDWPEFRGPTGQGHSDSKQLPLEWGPTKNVVWKKEVASGWSSPIVFDDKVFLTGAVTDAAGNPTSLNAMCYDATSGRLLWDTTVFEPGGAARKHGKNSHASPTPVAEGERVYVHFGPAGSAALDLEGRVVWRQDGLDYNPVHGNGGSPVIVDDKLIFHSDGGADPFIAALDKRTGEVAWKVGRDTSASSKFSFSTPLLINEPGGRRLISPASGAVMAYNPDDGAEIWRVDYGEGYSVVPRPVAGNDMIYLATGFNRPSVYAIKQGGEGDVTGTHLAWDTSRGAPNTPSMLLVGRELYFVSDGGVASCVDALTGETHWNERLGGGHSASPIHASGRVYFTNEEGVTRVLKAGTSFEVLATNDLAEKTLASPAASGPSLFLRTEKHLYRIQEPTP